MKETGLELKFDGQSKRRRQGKRIPNKGSNDFLNYIIRMASS